MKKKSKNKKFIHFYIHDHNKVIIYATLSRVYAWLCITCNTLNVRQNQMNCTFVYHVTHTILYYILVLLAFYLFSAACNIEKFVNMSWGQAKANNNYYDVMDNVMDYSPV